MRTPPHARAYQVLLLQAADDGRGPVLFGDSFERAFEMGQPFMVGEGFPSVYLEHPLAGEPFIDVTVLYGSLAPGTRIASASAKGTESALDWFAGICEKYPLACCGFELDTKVADVPPAAVHFQPRKHLELVEPFCKALGEPDRAQLYLDLAARMPVGWPLSFFGMFRGRPDSPLRVCGYLDAAEIAACAEDPGHLAHAFDTLGFSAYDGAMLSQISAYLHTAPGSVDFQFDVYPDGSIGEVFAIDVQFDLAQPAAVKAAFAKGPAANLMDLAEENGVADGRWKLSVASTLARSVSIDLDDGSQGRFAFTLMPGWMKIRWAAGALSSAKMYLNAHAGLLENT